MNYQEDKTKNEKKRTYKKTEKPKKRETHKIYNKPENGGGFINWMTSSSNSNKKMNYPLVTPVYNGKNIQCDVCQQIEFYKIQASIDRSKTATIIFGNDLGDIVSHPVKMYICTNCKNCKFVYAATRWNGLTDTILENAVTNPQVVNNAK